MRDVNLGNRVIGRDHPCFLIAEVGTTCLGDIDRALALVERAARAGVDAVKFQIIDPDQLSDDSVTYPIRRQGRTEWVSMREMFEQLSFSDDEWGRLAQAARAHDIEFFCTADHVRNVELLDRLGVPAHKVGAWDCTHRALIERMARSGKPIFVDLGPTTPAELAQIVSWHDAAGGGGLLFMHDFHTSDDSEMNLRAIRYLNDTLPWPAGFSSPARDDDLDMAALALGARHIEKRLILTRDDKAYHADESLEPDEFAKWVGRVRHVERALGVAAVRPTRVDREQSLLYYRSACTLRAIAEGETFTPENLGAKRPGTGIPVSRLPELWGRRASRSLPVNCLISEEHVS
jgi:sialic acid synthase SpsE